MKAILAITASTLIIGCGLTPQSAEPMLKDGIYRISSNPDIGEAIRIIPKNRQPITVYAEELTNYSPSRVYAFSGAALDEAWFIQIEGSAYGMNWSQEPILVIAAGKTYYETRKSGTSARSDATNEVKLPATISFTVPKAEEAKAVVNALCKRFSIKGEILRN